MSSYATPASLVQYGINAAALQPFTTQQQQAALDAASSVVDGYLGSRFQLPLVSWGEDLRRTVAIIAAFDLMMSRGLDPNHQATQVLQQRYDSAVTWCRDIAAGRVTPAVQDSSVTAAKDHGGMGTLVVQPQVSSGGAPAASQLSLGTAPPKVVTQADGSTLSVGSPRLRGW